MGFQKIEAEEKAQAVLEVLRGAKIIGIAGKYGVHRDSLSDWVKQVKGQIKAWVQPYRRGPKRKKPKTDPNLKKIEKLNQLLAKNQARIGQLEGQLRKTRKEEKEKEPRPAKCEHCDCKKVYKNGKYLIKPKRFFDLLKRKEQSLLIPQFVCANCGRCLYLELDRTLFFSWEDKQRN